MAVHAPGRGAIWGFLAYSVVSDSFYFFSNRCSEMLQPRQDQALRGGRRHVQRRHRGAVPCLGGQDPDAGCLWGRHEEERAGYLQEHPQGGRRARAVPGLCYRDHWGCTN